MVPLPHEYRLKLLLLEFPVYDSPPIEVEKETNDVEDEPVPPVILPANTHETGMNVSKGRGSFATRSFTLKKTK